MWCLRRNHPFWDILNNQKSQISGTLPHNIYFTVFWCLHLYICIWGGWRIIVSYGVTKKKNLTLNINLLMLFVTLRYIFLMLFVCYVFFSEIVFCISTFSYICQLPIDFEHDKCNAKPNMWSLWHIWAWRQHGNTSFKVASLIFNDLTFPPVNPHSILHSVVNHNKPTARKGKVSYYGNQHYRTLATS